MVEADGKWPGILANLGVNIPANGGHGPCPVCGGRDRFRFDDKEGTGSFICNQCGAGDGWGLLRRVFNCTFYDALDMVKPIVGDIPKQKRRRGMSDEKRREALIELWKASTPLRPGDPAWKYLQGRGLNRIPTVLRYCAKCYNSDEKKEMGAMIANFMDTEGKGVTIHRTYLHGDKRADIEKPKKMMPHNGQMAGGAVRLFPYTDTLGIAEGIETAIAAAQIFEIPTWAALSATLLEQWEPPDVRQVVIFGDRDKSYAGQKAAYVLANRLTTKGMIVNVEIPPKGDWADRVKDTN